VVANVADESPDVSEQCTDVAHSAEDIQARAASPPVPELVAGDDSDARDEDENSDEDMYITLTIA
jgi:hypothetical protein